MLFGFQCIIGRLVWWMTIVHVVGKCKLYQLLNNQQNPKITNKTKEVVRKSMNSLYMELVFCFVCFIL